MAIGVGVWGNFFMLELEASKTTGARKRKRRKKEEKKKEKEEEKRGKIVLISHSIANLKIVLYILPIFNMVNKLYLSPQIFCCRCTRHNKPFGRQPETKAPHFLVPLDGKPALQSE